MHAIERPQLSKDAAPTEPMLAGEKKQCARATSLAELREFSSIT
jgi:hypothetical protein